MVTSAGIPGAPSSFHGLLKRRSEAAAGHSTLRLTQPLAHLEASSGPSAHLSATAGVATRRENTGRVCSASYPQPPALRKAVGTRNAGIFVSFICCAFETPGQPRCGVHTWCEFLTSEAWCSLCTAAASSVPWGRKEPGISFLGISKLETFCFLPISTHPLHIL